MYRVNFPTGGAPGERIVTADDVTSNLAGVLLLTRKTGRTVKTVIGEEDEKETVLVLAPGEWLAAELVHDASD